MSKTPKPPKSPVVQAMEKRMGDKEFSHWIRVFLRAKEEFLKDRDNNIKYLDMIEALPPIQTHMKIWLNIGEISLCEFDDFFEALGEENTGENA